MRSAIEVTVALALLLPVSGAYAQSADELQIVRAGMAFVRDELPKGRIVIDVETFDIPRALADAIALDNGAAVGRLREERQCTVRQGRQQACNMKGNVTVVTFKRPVITDQSAEVVLKWWYQADKDLVGAKDVKLGLSRTAGGQWRVVKLLWTGMS
jgi:hypothetical protein